MHKVFDVKFLPECDSDFFFFSKILLYVDGGKKIEQESIPVFSWYVMLSIFMLPEWYFLFLEYLILISKNCIAYLLLLWKLSKIEYTELNFHTVSFHCQNDQNFLSYFTMSVDVCLFIDKFSVFPVLFD